MELDKTGLDSRIFDLLSSTSRRRYIFACNIKTGVSRCSKNILEDFDMPDEYCFNAHEIWGELIHPEDRKKYSEDVYAIFSGQKEDHFLDYRVLDKHGNYVMCTCRGKLSLGDNGEPDLFAGTIENHGITEMIDATTNLYNVYSFLQKIRKRDGRKWLIMQVGLNRFSIVNDVYGYVFGDKVLKCFADKLLSIIRGIGTVYRMDGAKFAVIFPNEMVDVEEIYTRIQQMTKNEILIEGNHIPLTVSCGVVRTDHADTGEYTIQASVRYALDKSKHTKHGELVFFQNEFQEYSRTTLELLDVMRQSVLDGCKGFYMCYQPVVEAERGKIIGMEALLRWNREPYGEVPPGRFIPWLENDPCFFELGNWILEQALTEGKHIVDENPNFIINVNVSATQLERRKFRESVMEILQKTGFPAENLCLELTERCRAMDKEYLKGEIHFLRSNGIKVALDDFGTGQSSLELLCEFPFDCLKIDRGFVRDIEMNRAAQVVVDSIVQCANGLGMKVCVEGVENEQLRDFIRQYKAHSYQGYLYSKPIRMEQFMKLLV